MRMPYILKYFQIGHIFMLKSITVFFGVYFYSVAKIKQICAAVTADMKNIKQKNNNNVYKKSLKGIFSPFSDGRVSQ